MISKNWKCGIAIAVSVSALLLLPNCRSTEHSVARVVTPTPGPADVFVPPAPEPARPTTTPAAPMPPPTVTPTVVGMPVVTAPAPGNERSPGVLYEQYVPTVVAVTPGAADSAPPTRTASPRSTRPRVTPTRAATQRPGVYYEDAEGRPLPTVTP